MTAHPFWSDNFDMDLPKVIPGAREIVGDLAGVKLVTQGHTTDGRLNHPSVWNDRLGMVAFFGFKSPARESFYHSSEPTVECTVWEAFRDAWAHSYVLIVEREPIWDTFALRSEFDTILYVERGWGVPTEAGRDLSVRKSTLTLKAAVERLRGVCRRHGIKIGEEA